MSMFEPECPHCGTSLSNRTGWLFSCPRCGSWFEVCGSYLQPRPEPDDVAVLDLTNGETAVETT